MGFNIREIKLFEMVQGSTKSSYTFLKKHPFVSCALLFCIILYMFLSNIYNFMAYLSPFLVCAAIFVRIFWSSEQTQFKYIKREEEKSEQRKFEPRLPRIPNNRRREMLNKYPSQNATSRRRNFRGKKLDVYGGLEEKPKDLSEVFHNEYTARNHIRSRGCNKSFDRGECSSSHGSSSGRNQAPRRQQMLRSKPSMRDLVEANGDEIKREKVDDADDEDEYETEDERNKAVIEWTEDDQRNLVDLGHSELERNNRLESLMAKRKEKKVFKLQPEDSLADKKTPIPRHIAPVLISRGKYLKGNDVDDGLETPSSALSAVPRSPYDIPYDPSEERPILTGGSFHQEFIIDPNDIMSSNKQESFGSGSHFPPEGKQERGAFHHNPFYNSGRKHNEKLEYQRFRRLPDRGSHDWLIDQFMYNEGGEIGFKQRNSLEKGKEITQKEDGKFKNVMVDMKDKRMETTHETKSIADHTSEPNLNPNISNAETSSVSGKPGLRFVLPHGGIISIPISTTTATATTTIANANEQDNILSPIKRHESVFFPDRRICHTPTYSIASDLQVEVSEVGSLASTVDENGETNSNTDRDSMLYDGDIDRDRDASSGSEELWGASFHGRHNAHRVREEDVSGATNESKDTSSTNALRQIDEENVADVSSMSSRCDVHEDYPTHARSSDRKNIFAYMNYSMGESEAPQSSYPSSSVSSPPKLLVDTSVEYLPNETQSQMSEVWSNMSEHLIDGQHVTNGLNNSAAIEQDTIENSRSNNEDPNVLVARQESIDDTSIFSVASSPRSVLPEKSMDEEASSSVYDQQITSSRESNNMEDMVQETSNRDQRSLDTILLQNSILPDGITDGSHSIDLTHSQQQANPPMSSMEETNMLDYMNDTEVSNQEEEDMSKNYENSEEDNSSHINRKETIVESSNQAGETTTENMDEKSRELVGK